jgi:hypothetical protein
MANGCWVRFHDSNNVGFVGIPCNAVDRSKMTPLELNIRPPDAPVLMAVRHKDSNVEAIIDRKDFNPKIMERLNLRPPEALAHIMVVRHKDSNVEAIIDRKDFNPETMADLTEEFA